MCQKLEYFINITCIICVCMWQLDCEWNKHIDIIVIIVSYRWYICQSELIVKRKKYTNYSKNNVVKPTFKLIIWHEIWMII